VALCGFEAKRGSETAIDGAALQPIVADLDGPAVAVAPQAVQQVTEIRHPDPFLRDSF